MIKNIYITIVSIITCLSLPVYSEPINDPEKTEPAYNYIDVAAGLFFLSSRQMRGATIYNRPSLLPSATVSLFENKLRILGPVTRYTQPLGEKWKFIIGTSLISDEPMLELFGDQKSLRGSRDTAFEGLLGISYKPLRLLELQASISQEFIEHHGQYADVQVLLGIGVIRRSLGPPWAIFKVFNSVGAGNKDHNRYLYGMGADQGVSNYQVGLQVVSPQLFPNVFAKLESTYFVILGSKQRNAALVRDKKDGVQGSVLISYQFF